MSLEGQKAPGFTLDGKVQRHWRPVQNAEEHPKDVLQFLQK